MAASCNLAPRKEENALLPDTNASSVGPIYRFADTDVSVSANRILVSAISVSASVSSTLDIGYIGIGKNTRISPKISAYIGQNTSYRLNIGKNENIGIGIGKYIGWENISWNLARTTRAWHLSTPFLAISVVST